MFKKSALLAAPILALGAMALAAAPASAADTWTWQGNLQPLNGSGGSGSVMISVTGDQATVHEEVSGLAETFNDGPYPHVQHIHIDGQGVCPSPDADTDGDGIVSTPEGHPAYGMIGTTLSTSGDTSAAAATDLKVAGMGGSYTYDRTFTINPETLESLKAGTAVAVVHGLDPATLPKAAQEKMSPLVPELPAAATAPTLCGTFTASQITDMPKGAPDTGVTASVDHTGNAVAVAGGGAMLLAAGAAVALGRKYAKRTEKENTEA